MKQRIEKKVINSKIQCAAWVCVGFLVGIRLLSRVPNTARAADIILSEQSSTSLLSRIVPYIPPAVIVLTAVFLLRPWKDWEKVRLDLKTQGYVGRFMPILKVIDLTTYGLLFFTDLTIPFLAESHVVSEMTEMTSWIILWIIRVMFLFGLGLSLVWTGMALLKRFFQVESFPYTLFKLSGGVRRFLTVVLSYIWVVICASPFS